MGSVTEIPEEVGFECGLKFLVCNCTGFGHEWSNAILYYTQHNILIVFVTLSMH